MNPDQPSSPRSSPLDAKRSVPLDLHADLVRSWHDARATFGRARATVDRIEAELLALLGDADVGTLGGLPAVEREIEKRTGIDLPRLRRECPELVDQYRVLRRRPVLKFPRHRRINP
ncbi:hypothetical protein HUW46_02142 [Amycolatopsis sp. CA-230715]|nr:hypothetical protein HUW46_02142 [Amycolatopsis sp. CA-230715]